MKALVIGASGQVGRCIFRRLRDRGDDVAGTYCVHPAPDLQKLDIGDGAAVDAFVRHLRPDVVYLPGSLTNVDLCEDNRTEAFRVNVQGTQNVVAAASGAASYLVHFSTDYVFDGARGPAKETDAPSPIQHYGFTKLEGERIVAASQIRAAIVRTAWVYSYAPDGANFFMFLHGSMKAGRPVYCYTDQKGTPSYAPNVAEAAIEMADNRLRGVFHVVGPDSMDRVTYAKKVAAAFGLDASLIHPVRWADRPQKAKRPADGGLDGRDTQARIATRMMTVDDAFADIAKRMAG